MTYATEPHPNFIEGSALSSLILVVHTVAPPLLFVFLFEEWFLIYDLCSKAPPPKKRRFTEKPRPFLSSSVGAV